MQWLWLSGGDPMNPAERERQRHAIELYSSEALLKEPLAFFREPEPAEVAVTRRHAIRGGSIERLRWPSRYRTWDQSYQSEYDRYRENGVAHAEWFRHEKGGAPTILCLHSWAAGLFPLHREAFRARRFYQLGFDVVLFILPFHGPRMPASARFSGQLFPGTSIHRTNEGFGQLIWDLRALMRYLESAKSGPIGAIGMSLGGYASALLASVEPKLRFSIPMIPLVSWADLLWMHGDGHPKRREAEATGISLESLRKVYAVHTPLQHAPLVPREMRMIIAGKNDRVCPREHVAMLWEHWYRPEIHYFAG
jgi:dienelactone hydrolase